MANISDDPSQLQGILKQLKTNFKVLRTKDLDYRKQVLKELVRGYRQMRNEFNQALKKDLGYNQFMSGFAAHSIFQTQTQHLISNLKSWAKPKGISTPVGLGLASCQLKSQPLGVALVISAWNYPIYTALPQVAYAISAGNCVVLKPSQIASYTSNALAKLFEKYLDQKFYRVVQGKVQVAKAITKLPFDIICFTGSTMTGRLVAMEAAKNLTPCILELGGKCPVIIDQTAKIQSAAMRILFGKFFNCGQTCIGVDHVYVHKEVQQQFKKKIVQKAQQFYGNGQKLSQEGNYGKIINDFHLKRLSKLLKDDHKGTIIYGGQIQQDKLYISPTIVWEPSKDSLLMKEQIFGPILPIFVYESLLDVVQQINQRAKPLVVYHFSQDSGKIKYVKENTSSGAYTVNDTVVQMLNAELPFGGVGGSGYGRFHGQSGFTGFSNPKSICKTKAVNSYPLSVRFPPYTQSKKNVVGALVKFGSITYSQIFRFVAALIVVIALVVLGIIFIPKIAN